MKKYCEIIEEDYIKCPQYIIEGDKTDTKQLTDILKKDNDEHIYIRLCTPLEDKIDNELTFYYNRSSIVDELNKNGYHFIKDEIMSKNNWIYEFYNDDTKKITICFCQHHRLYDELSELHVTIVNQIVNFIKKYNIKADNVELYADELIQSAEYGEWTPITDSYLGFYNNIIKNGKREKETLFYNC